MNEHIRFDSVEWDTRRKSFIIHVTSIRKSLVKTPLTAIKSQGIWFIIKHWHDDINKPVIINFILNASEEEWMDMRNQYWDTKDHFSPKNQWLNEMEMLRVFHHEEDANEAV